MPYQRPPLETDLDAVTLRLFDALATRLPGWVPIEGSLDTVITEEVGRETVLTNNRMLTVLDLGIVALGETVFGFPAQVAGTAEMEVDVTVTTVGDVIPAGLLVVGTNEVGVEVAFELPASATAVSNPQRVTMYATQPGLAGNGVPAGALVVATASSTVVAAAAVSPSEGGVPEEEIGDYLTRLVDYLSILRVGAVRASDVEFLARTVTGVHRARAVDLYDAMSDTDGVERTVTVFLVGPNGLPVPSSAEVATYQLLERVREINLVIYVATPTYTPITVAFTAIAEPGHTPATVQADVIAALTTHLSPARWGTTVENSRAWVPSNVVRYLDLVAVAGTVPGVSFLTSLTINGTTADVTLPGRAPLPAPTTGSSPTTISGTVT